VALFFAKTMNPLQAAYQQVLKTSKLKDLQDVASNPQTANIADNVVGGVAFGMPITKAYTNAKNLITDPVKEIKRRDAEYSALTPEQKQEMQMNSVIASTVGSKDTPFDRRLFNNRTDSEIKLIKQARAIENHINSSRVKPKNTSEESLKKLIEDNGGIYTGVMKSGNNSVVNFNAKRGETVFPMALETNNLTPEIIKAKIAEKSKDDVADLVRKVNTKYKKGR
jgi:hypothetical protein